MKRLIRSITLAVRRCMKYVARALNAVSGGRVTPNSVTLFGFAMHVPIAYLIATGHLVWAAVLLVIFGLFDALDGELARLQGSVTSTGGFLDASTDRFKEVLLYSGAGYLLAGGPHPQLAALAVAACGASICVSFVKAKGEAVIASGSKTLEYPELNRLFSGGLFPFEIRMFVLVIGLAAGRLEWAVGLIAICASMAAGQRLVRIGRALA